MGPNEFCYRLAQELLKEYTELKYHNPIDVAYFIQSILAEPKAQRHMKECYGVQ